MEGTIEISDFMRHLERNNLVIAPRHLVDENLKVRKLQKAAMQKQMLSFREIYEAQLWGNDIQLNSIKAYATKYAKDGEIISVSKGERKISKITRAAVVRLAKKRGTWATIAE